MLVGMGAKVGGKGDWNQASRLGSGAVAWGQTQNRAGDSTHEWRVTCTPGAHCPEALSWWDLGGCVDRAYSWHSEEFADGVMSDSGE